MSDQEMREQLECGDGKNKYILLLDEPGNLKQIVIEFLKWDGGEGSRAYDAHKYRIIRNALCRLCAGAVCSAVRSANGQEAKVGNEVDGLKARNAGLENIRIQGELSDARAEIERLKEALKELLQVYQALYPPDVIPPSVRRAAEALAREGA